MERHPVDSWRRPGGPPQSEPPGQGNLFGGFGGPPQGPSHVLPPPSASYHQSQPSGGHSLSIADLTQGPKHYDSRPPPPQGQHIPPISHGSLGQHSPPYMNRDRELANQREREYREQEMRDRDMRERELQQRRLDETMMRERDARDRQERLQLEQEQQRPVQSHAGALPLHQPVANKVGNQIHGPNGLLSNNSAVQSASGAVSNGVGGLFGMERPPPFMQQPQGIGGPPSQQQQPPPPFIGGPSPLPAAAQLSHGQQPILNDALSYLDQVKVKFSDQPDVYNRFLDIMKDFKSQAIDTPGVIERVSNLFNGHPSLIQGFNTFLPPGYRIECGTADNPDAIRVTTPSGTMTQSLQSRLQGPLDPSGLSLSSQGQQQIGRQDPFDDRASWNRADDAMLNQQEQRGVSSLQNAANVAANGSARANSPSRDSAQPYPGPFATVADAKRGGPVEFNHAISYVNKIKNRFSQQPEIYKQFLEILQTYQREAKPIQDVYAQVTTLFHAAPDLLEDFKQFLPDTAAQAKTQASARVSMDETSNVRGEPGYAPQAQTPRPAAKMPPMGQFDPPSTSKDNKKRRGGPSGQTGPSALDVAASSGRMPVQVGNANKRQKTSGHRQLQTEMVVTSPTLTPALPEPMPPYPNISSTVEELGFFDRAKKQIANRSSYAEFLKLINLYSQDLIDKYSLADRIQSFLAPNGELIAFFRDFLQIEEQEEINEAKARADTGRVNLSHCRSMGPSYRHLPLRDQNKPCKGRDGMCYEVLNDVWASHPTWASEDSGFVAHRKNQHEEALHRIEEERHDYDFHIETCQRSIQLMEPIVQSFRVMDENARTQFVLQPGFGGASESIPKRIIMKVYGRDMGARVLTELYRKPLSVMPVVLNRLKQKLEEWKSTQREWEKIWRDQINKQFWKSLDHQGINVKSIDKKAFQPKGLISDIQNKYEEAKKKRENGDTTKRHHLEFKFEDVEVIVDATKLMLVTLLHDRNDRNGFSVSDQDRVKAWILDFVPRFFGLNHEEFADRVRIEPVDGSADHDGNESDDTGLARRGRKGGGLGSGLIRRIFNKTNGNGNVDSALNSKESTPMPTPEQDDAEDEEAPPSESEEPMPEWIRPYYGDAEAPPEKPSLEEVIPHETYNLYANVNIYCFFRVFEMLYSRLVSIKANEASVREAVKRHIASGPEKKAAIELRMIDKDPQWFFPSRKPTNDLHYYHGILHMIEDVIQGTIELSHLEETLRRYYNKTGWQLYTVDKLLGSLLRFVAQILGGDVKDKSVEITNLFFKNREMPESTRRQELEYRRQVQNMSKDKDGEIYCISYNPDQKFCTIRYFPKEEPTFESDGLNDDQLWQYYMASYAMREPTEGIDYAMLRKTHLVRNIPAQAENLDEAFRKIYELGSWDDQQSAFVHPDSYKLLLNKPFIMDRVRHVPQHKAYQAGQINTSKNFKDRFVRYPPRLKEEGDAAFEYQNTLWRQNVTDGFYYPAVEAGHTV